MTNDCAANIFNAGIRIMKCLGWAWQWASWWVHFGDNWEPFLEEGQNESNMTKAELKIIDSTSLSRRADARKCRLAPLGAALRNREYDKTKGDDCNALHNALRAILSVPSLAGPLTKAEIDFFVDWLGRVYRSQSPELGFGDEKIAVSETYSKGSVTHYKDETPKYELEKRPLPGKKLKKGEIFESGITEADDYSEIEEFPLAMLLTPKGRSPSSISSIGSSSKKSTGKSKKSSASSKTKKRSPRDLPLSYTQSKKSASSACKNLVTITSSNKKRSYRETKSSTPRSSASSITSRSSITTKSSRTSRRSSRNSMSTSENVISKENSMDISVCGSPSPSKDTVPTINAKSPRIGISIQKKPTLNDPIPKKRRPGRPKKNPI